MKKFTDFISSAKDIIYILTFIGGIGGGILAWSASNAKMKYQVEILVDEMKETNRLWKEQLVLNGQIIQKLKENSEDSE